MRDRLRCPVECVVVETVAQARAEIQKGATWHAIVIWGVEYDFITGKRHLEKPE